MSDIVEIVLDIETTGLHLKDGHKIIEIGCVELKNRKRTGRIFHQYINPQRQIDLEAISVHGIKNEALFDKPVFSEIAQDFYDFIGDAFIVAHNGIAFDIRFLNNELKSKGLSISTNKVIDSLLLARKKFPGSPASLDALCKRFNISLESRKLHGALLDAELLASVYISMQGPVQNEIALEAFHSQSDSSEELTLHLCSKRSFHLDNFDVKMHKSMLQNLNDPLWLKYHEKELD